MMEAQEETRSKFSMGKLDIKIVSSFRRSGV